MADDKQIFRCEFTGRPKVRWGRDSKRSRLVRCTSDRILPVLSAAYNTVDHLKVYVKKKGVWALFNHEEIPQTWLEGE